MNLTTFSYKSFDRAKQSNIQNSVSIKNVMESSESNFEKMIATITDLHRVGNEAAGIIQDEAGFIRACFDRNVLKNSLEVGSTIEIHNFSVLKVTKYSKFINIVSMNLKTIFPKNGGQEICIVYDDLIMSTKPLFSVTKTSSRDSTIESSVKIHKLANSVQNSPTIPECVPSDILPIPTTVQKFTSNSKTAPVISIASVQTPQSAPIKIVEMAVDAPETTEKLIDAVQLKEPLQYHTSDDDLDVLMDFEFDDDELLKENTPKRQKTENPLKELEIDLRMPDLDDETWLNEDVF